MVGKFAKELTSRMLLLLSMMEAWMQNLNILKLERLSSQVNLVYVEQIIKYGWFMDVKITPVARTILILRLVMNIRPKWHIMFLTFIVGYVFTRGGYVELSTKLSLPLGSTLDRFLCYLSIIIYSSQQFVLKRC